MDYPDDFILRIQKKTVYRKIHKKGMHAAAGLDDQRLGRQKVFPAKQAL